VSDLTSSDPFWDALDKVEAEGLVRECPNCHEQPDDVKFAIHSKRIAGCDLSALCNSCHHSQQCDMGAAESLVRRWHAAQPVPQSGDSGGRA